jgi:hypothetical protein
MGLRGKFRLLSDELQEDLQAVTHFEWGPDSNGFIKLDSDPSSPLLRLHTSLADFVLCLSRELRKRLTASLNVASFSHIEERVIHTGHMHD